MENIPSIICHSRVDLRLAHERCRANEVNTKSPCFPAKTMIIMSVTALLGSASRTLYHTYKTYRFSSILSTFNLFLYIVSSTELTVCAVHIKAWVTLTEMPIVRINYHGFPCETSDIPQMCRQTCPVELISIVYLRNLIKKNA